MKLSVICPTENRSAFMPLLGNTYRSLECPEGWESELVVIDSSTDVEAEKTYAELERYVPGSQLRYRWHPEHGCTIAEKRNLGLELCTGDYVTWLDDDDIRAPGWFPWAVRTLGDKKLLRVKMTVPFIAISIEPMLVRYIPTQWYSIGLYDVELARSVRFLTHHGSTPNWTGEDVEWHGKVIAATPVDQQVFLLHEGWGATLSHTLNIANSALKPAPWRHELKQPAGWTEIEWYKTMSWIADLRKRLGYIK